ncbi:MAG: hypothetical protein H6709_04100 [Kofleriaceae bacterium]|nr:hypothetical protein [Myxococcales bacterium]MCB9560185.1 hypothetical protein [Kofleriaceae bacterium]MCB9571253.1 hypothetical protein [Kofleriaceae bacterium]
MLAAELDHRASFPYRDMSPEEYAARNAADILVFSLADYRYRDADLDRWMVRLQEILCDWTVVNECRRRYLTPEEMARALERDAEEP